MQVKYGNRITASRNMETRELSAIVELIRGSKSLRDDVSVIRELSDKHIRNDKKKESLPFFTCNNYKDSHRVSECFIDTDGLIFDIDGIDNVQEIKQAIIDKIEGVVCVFESPSGDGVKFILRLAERLGGDYYTDIYEHYANAFAVILGVKVDMQCKDLARACYMSYDESVWYDANVAGVNWSVAKDVIDSKRRNRVNDNLAIYQYNDSERGHADILEIMREDKGYIDVSERGGLHYLARPSKTTTSATVSDGTNPSLPVIGLYMWTTSDDDFKAGFVRREEEGKALYRPFDVLMHTRFKGDMTGASEYLAGLGFRDKAFERRDTSYDQLWGVLSSRWRFRMDIRDNLLELSEWGGSWVEMTEIWEAIIVDYMESKLKFPVQWTTLGNIIISRCDKFDVMAEWIDSLKTVQSVEGLSIESYLRDTIGVVNDLQVRIFRRWMIAGIGSVIDDRTANEICIVLKGDQRIGKTRWIRWLCPKELRGHYYEGAVADDKDSMIKVARNFIVNMDEFETTTKKAQVGKLKSLMSSVEIKERLPYGRREVAFKKYASFMASVNEDEFLYDVTGNSRFPVFDLGGKKVNQEYMMNVDINVLWKEALDAFLAGERTWLDDEELDYVEQATKAYVASGYLEDDLKSRYMFFTKDDWEKFVRYDGERRYVVLRTVEDGEVVRVLETVNELDGCFEMDLEFLTATQMFLEVSGKESVSPTEQYKFSRTLSKTGSWKKSVRVNGVVLHKAHAVLRWVKVYTVE